MASAQNTKATGRRYAKYILHRAASIKVGSLRFPAARMTGAGVGGCAVSIVKNECVDNVNRSVGEAYKQKIGYAADFYVVEIGAGPEVL